MLNLTTSASWDGSNIQFSWDISSDSGQQPYRSNLIIIPNGDLTKDAEISGMLSPLLTGFELPAIPSSGTVAIPSSYTRTDDLGQYFTVNVGPGNTYTLRMIVNTTDKDPITGYHNYVDVSVDIAIPLPGTPAPTPPKTKGKGKGK